MNIAETKKQTDGAIALVLLFPLLFVLFACINHIL